MICFRIVLQKTLTLLLVVSVTPSLYAQDLNLFATVDTDVAGPGDRLTYTHTVTNTGATDLLDVAVEIQLPGHITNFFAPPGLNCGTCVANETAVWSVGILAPGENRTLFYSTFVQNAAPAGTITSSATASASNASDVSTSVDVTVDLTPLLQLSLAPQPGPAVAGEPFTYTLTFGNVGSTSPANVVLTMPLPEGTSFASATGGGSESGGVVTWNLGQIGAGAGGQRQLTIELEAGLDDGDVLQAEATIDPNVATESVVRSQAVTPVRQGVPLRIAYAVSQTAAGPGDRLTYTLTATNTGATDLLDVEARLLLPSFIQNFFAPPGLDCGTCTANETTVWSAGALAPGESRTLFFTTFVQNAAPSGEVLRSLLVGSSSSIAGQVTAAQDVLVDPTPLLQLSLAPESGPAVAGEAFTYTLTFGNVGTTSPSSVVLTMPLPEGTSFVSASDGGTESSGVVTWNLGQIGAGAGGRVQVTVELDAGLDDGTLLAAWAEINSGIATESIVRSQAVTPVRQGVPLRIAYAVSQTAAGPGDRLTYTLTATNTGATDLLDVEARLLLPSFIQNFFAPPGLDCGTCTANETTVWSAGALAPGESRTLFFTTFVQNAAPSGEVLRSLLVGSSSSIAGQVTAAQDVLVDPTPLLQLSLAPQPGPAVAGEPFTYTLTFGNVGTTSPANVVLTMPLPEGTSFASATGGGSESGGVVTWNLGQIGAGAGGQRQLTVELEAGLGDGDVLQAEAAIDPNVVTESVVRSQAVTPVRQGAPLHVEYVASDTAVEPGEDLTYTLTVTNTGSTDLLDVEARLLLPSFIQNFFAPPGLDCGTCTANETTVWSVGPLPPDESRTLVLELTVTNGAPRGQVLRSPGLATTSSTGTGEVFFQRDVLVGEEIDPPPGATLTKPAGWSLTSLPVSLPPATSLDAIFDHFISAFTYEPQSGYVPADAPEATEGFWLNLSAAETVTLTGERIDSYTKDAPAGWSLLGGLTDAPAAVSTDPPGALAALFRFEPGAGYVATELIPPGEAVWINCTAPCEVSAEPDDGAPLSKTLAALQEALITATGDTRTGYVNRGHVVLGTAEAHVSTPYPPPLPAFTTQLRLWSPADGQALYRDVRPSNTEAKTWVLEVDPNGNAAEPGTTTLSWDGAALAAIADVPWTLRHDGTGALLVKDMRRTTALTLSGTEPLLVTIAAGVTATGAEAAALPEAFALGQNYPNPFNPVTTIGFDVPEAARVTLRVYNVLGQVVQVLVEGTVAAGRHTVEWDGRDQAGAVVPSGIYVCRMEAAGFVQARRMVFLK